MNKDLLDSIDDQFLIDDGVTFIPVQQNDDGSIDYELVEELLEEIEETTSPLDDPMALSDPLLFHANLALYMKEEDLDQLGSTLLAAIQEDDSSREEWKQARKKILQYFGVAIEADLQPPEVPFKNAAGFYDTTLSNAVVQFCSTVTAELFPMQGVCSVQVMGREDDYKVQSASRLQDFFNYHLTVTDRNYYPDSSRLIMYVALFGCAFRKVCFDPEAKYPTARMVSGNDLIVNNNCTSIAESPRVTHQFPLTAKDLLSRMRDGLYKEVLLTEITKSGLDGNGSQDFKDEINKQEGLNTNHETDLGASYLIYECHVDLSFTDFQKDRIVQGQNPDVPKPYLVTLLDTGKIISIRRNWKIYDQYCQKTNVFVQYNYFSGLGAYGYGLGHLMGANTIYITKLMRQIANAESLKIFPRGFKKKGIESRKSNYLIGPNEFIDIDSTKPFNELFYFLETPPQSGLLVDLLRDIRQQTASLSVVTNAQIPESSYNAPVGTILALIEKQNVVTNVILQGLHRSLSEEMQLLYELFSDGVNSGYGVMLPGKFVDVKPEDFSPEMRLLPSSNASVSSFAHSLIKAESILRMAQQAPELHEMRNVYRNVYESMKLTNIDEILPPPPPPNPNEKPPIDPNDVLARDVENKMQVAVMKHETELMKLAIQKTKMLQDYAIQYQKMVAEYAKAGLEPPKPVSVPTPHIPLPPSQAMNQQDTHMNSPYGIPFQASQEEQDTQGALPNDNEAQQDFEGQFEQQQDDQLDPQGMQQPQGEDSNFSDNGQPLNVEEFTNENPIS